MCCQRTSSVECVSLELERPEQQFVGMYICGVKIFLGVLLVRDFLNSWGKKGHGQYAPLVPSRDACGGWDSSLRLTLSIGDILLFNDDILSFPPTTPKIDKPPSQTLTP